MCLITNQSKAFIAEEDMVVYKALLNTGIGLSAIFFHFIYEMNKLYETKIKKSLHNFYAADDIDCKILEEQSGRDLMELRNSEYVSYGEGFHSALTIQRAKDISHFKNKRLIVMCIIPKGSKYFINPSGLAISNRIIIKKILNT